jgi:hypothetical protein
MPRRSKFYDPSKASTTEQRKKTYPGISKAQDYALRIGTAEYDLLGLWLTYGRSGIEQFISQLEFTIGDKYRLFTNEQQEQLAKQLSTDRANAEAARWSADVELHKN